MTSEPRPDALTAWLPGSEVHRFTDEDLAELVVLQRCCWVQEALANETLDIPALHESHDQVLAWAQSWHTLIVRVNGRLVASVRGRAEDRRWHVGRLMVAPDLAGRGIGAALLRLCERLAPATTEEFHLFTGGRSARNLRFYQAAGYRLVKAPVPPGHIAGAAQLIKTRTIAG